MLGTVAEVLARRIAGHTLTASELEAALTKRDKLPQPETGALAIIPVHGVLVPRGNLFSDVSGATSLDKLSAQFQAAMASEAVSTIVLDVDSPGGSVAGTTEFAREIMKARLKKPIVAVAQYTMASAAYWIASAATEIVASPSAAVGSIGVYAMHDDLSKALEQLGIKRTYISAGKFKVDGNETEPLSESALDHMQGIVNAAYDRFLTDVSRGRGITKDAVKTGYGQGRMLLADDAMRAGMIDTVATLDDTIARLMTPSKDSKRAIRSDTRLSLDTPQEPSPATGQDRTDREWVMSIERALLEFAI